MSFTRSPQLQEREALTTGSDLALSARMMGVRVEKLWLTLILRFMGYVSFDLRLQCTHTDVRLD